MLALANLILLNYLIMKKSGKKSNPGAKNVSLTYKSGQNVIQNNSLSYKKGFYVALALLGGLVLYVFSDFLFMHATCSSIKT
jgi:hypothetical protein